MIETLTMKWQKVIISGITLASLLVITGCSLLSEEDKFNYKSAGKLPPLDIPPDLIAPSADERYAIPDTSQSGSATYSTYNQGTGDQPRSTALSPSVLPLSGDGVHIERAGTQRWLVVPQEPEIVWPVVREFWQELGFLIKTEEPETGIMETDWAESRAKIPQGVVRNLLARVVDSLYSTAERDKFRTRLERGENGTTEIYISHRGMDEVVEGGSTQRTVWQPRPADPDMEAKMLTRLMLRFGVEQEQSELELATLQNTSQTRAYIDKTHKDILVVNEAFDRSWRRVGLALDRIGFTVEDRNRLEGVYFVRYINPDLDTHKTGTDDGILSRLVFWRKDAEKTAEKHLISVKETGANSSHVKVYDENNKPVDLNTASRILNLLHDQLR